MARRGDLLLGPASPRRGGHRRWRVRALLGVLAALLLVRAFVAELVVARGSMMAPNVLDGDVLLVVHRPRPQAGDVVVVEGNDGPPVLRRVLGIAGDRFQVIEGLLYRNGQPMPARTVGAFAYRDGDESGPQRRQQLLEETLETGRAHRVLGDYEGAARPWALELPVIEVPPGHLFLLCDNRRLCPLDDRLGSVPAARVQGVARSLVWYGDARAEPPASQPFYGAFAPLVSGVPPSGGNVTGEPRK